MDGKVEHVELNALSPEAMHREQLTKSVLLKTDTR